MIGKILVPLDGSQIAESVLPYVQEMASRTGAQVLLLTCIQPIVVWDATATTFSLDREEEFAQGYLDGRRQALEAEGLKVRTKVVQGPAAESILKVAAEEGADLIAMSTHGRSGLTRWLFGSVATKVLEGCDRPLFLVRSSAEAKRGRPATIEKVLVPLDGSSLAESVLPFVEEVAAAFGASILLYHAITPLSAYPGFETVLPAHAGELLADLQAQAEQFLQRVAGEVRERGCQVSVAVSVDLAVDGILGAAKESGAGLIALGTHGRSGLGRAIMGSVADAVVRRADVPCLLVHPKEPKK